MARVHVPSPPSTSSVTLSNLISLILSKVEIVKIYRIVRDKFIVSVTYCEIASPITT